MTDAWDEHRRTAVSLPVPRGAEVLALAPYLITNDVAVDILNHAGLNNGDDAGGYRFVNIHNPAHPIRRNPDSGRYEVAETVRRHPLVGVSWLGAATFARILGGRLPTVAEWVYAATCADTRRYPWGDDPPSPGRANYGERYGAPTPVGTFAPNPWGLFDMAGNVAQWCMDEPSDTFDPVAEYPVKGGAWNKLGLHLECRFTRRKWGRIGTMGIGVRLAYSERLPHRHHAGGPTPAES